MPASRFLTSICLCLATMTISTAGAQENSVSIISGLSTLNYSSRSSIALGDTVSARNPTVPLKRCVEYNGQSDVKEDNTGSVQSSVHIYLVKDYSDFERQWGGSVEVLASGGVNFADLFGGSAETKLFGKFENFIKQETNSMMVVIEAAADNGRDYIANYQLKTEYQKLLDQNKYQEFAKHCGTHFVRAITRRSALRVIFNIENISKSGKTAVEGRFSHKGEAKANLSDFGANAKAEVSVNLSNVLKVASKLGKVSVDMDAVGGTGIAGLSNLASSINVENSADITKLLDGISQAAHSFTRANSAPSQFLLVPLVEPGLAIVGYDPKRYEHLATIFKRIIRIDQLVSKYEGYKTKSPEIWSRYFQAEDQKIREVRSKLVEIYNDCLNANSCTVDLPKELSGLILDDITFNGATRVTCPLGLQVDAALNSTSSVKTSMVSSIIVAWSGGLRYVPDLDLDGTELFRVNESGSLLKLDFRAARQFRKTTDDRGATIGYFTVYRQNIDPSIAVKQGKIDYGYLGDIRSDVAQSLFIIRFRLVNGMKVDEVIGYPTMSGCRLIEEDT